MKRTTLLGFFGILSFLLTSHVWAFNVTVQDNGGTSTNGSFVGNVWTPTADSILDYADLNPQLTAANTTIDTNGTGTITISAAFSYSAANDRLLTLTATGNIDILGINSTTNSLAVTATSSTGDLSVNTGGIQTNGGDIDFTTNGNTAIGGGGINTSGGKIELSSTTGTLLITDNGINSDSGDIELTTNLDINSNSGGITSNGGEVTISSLDGGISASSNGIQAGTGFVNLTALNNISLSGGGIDSGGAYIEGANLTVADNGIDTNGDNLIVRFTGDVSIAGNGIRTDGGNISITRPQSIFITDGGIDSAGGDIELTTDLNITSTSGGIASSGGDVTLTSRSGGISASNNGIQAGTGFVSLIAQNDISLSGNGIVSEGASIEGANLTVTNGGINTNGGNLIARLTGDVTIDSGGVFSGGGDISITSAQSIFVNSGRTIESEGGEITLIAETAIVVADDAPIDSSPGAGGTLTVDPGVTISNTPPTVGAGNISLLMRLFVPAPVPTLSEWSLILLVLMMGLIGIRFGRNNKVVVKRF